MSAPFFHAPLAKHLRLQLWLMLKLGIILHVVGFVRHGWVGFVPPGRYMELLPPDPFERTVLERAVLQAQTPYGPITKHFDIVQPGSQTVTIEVACPKALFHTAITRSGNFRRLCEECSGSDNRLQVLMYMDDVKPGNVLRPDKGRTYYSWLWTFLEFPSWWIQSDAGWIDVCCVTQKQLEHVVGGNSVVFQELFHFFFAVEWVIDIAAAGPGRYVLTIDWGALLADMKALVQVAMTKGASSYKCCLKCAHIVGRVSKASCLEAEREGSPLRHYTTLDASGFHEYTAEEWADVCNEVRDAWQNGDAGAKDLESACGVTYGGGRGLPWGPAAEAARFPERVYIDSMHTIYASGGVAQHECTVLLRRIRKAGIPPVRMQEFFEHVAFPGKKKMFNVWERMKAKHVIRAFAADMLQLIPALVFLCDLVLAGVLEQEIECLRLLYGITCVLHRDELAVDSADVRFLDQMIVEHQRLFVQIYSSSTKPKLHFMRHLPSQIRRFRKHIDCFTCERHHKQGKKIAATVFRHFGPVVLRRSVLRWLDLLGRSETFDPYSLVSRTRGQSQWRFLASSMNLEILARGNHMHTLRGWVRNGDFVVWETDEVKPTGVRVGGGFVLEALRVRNPEQLSKPLLVVQEATLLLRLRHRWVFRKVVDRNTLVPPSRVMWIACTWSDGDAVHVLVPYFQNDLTM